MILNGVNSANAAMLAYRALQGCAGSNDVRIVLCEAIASHIMWCREECFGQPQDLIGKHRGFCNYHHFGSCRLVLHIVSYAFLFCCVAVHALLELIIRCLNSHVN